MDAIGGIAGPKTLVIVSRGLVPGRSPHLDVRAEIQARGADRRARQRPHLRAVPGHERAGGLLGRAAQAPATAFEDEASLASGLQMLAGMSAGSLFTVAAGAGCAFERVARETSAAYVLGLEAEQGDRDGKPHRIQVRVRIPNTTVRSRESFIVPAAAPAPATPDEAVAAALKPGGWRGTCRFASPHRRCATPRAARCA